jgi:hypothetical protein
MSIIEFGFYALIWTVVSTGLTFMIAAAFFGYAAKEISEEEYNDLLKRK